MTSVSWNMSEGNLDCKIDGSQTRSQVQGFWYVYRSQYYHVYLCWKHVWNVCMYMLQNVYRVAIPMLPRKRFFFGNVRNTKLSQYFMTMWNPLISTLSVQQYWPIKHHFLVNNIWVYLTHGQCRAKRSLMAWVGAIPKEGRTPTLRKKKIKIFQKKVKKSRCHTKRRAGAAQAQDIRDLFT